MALYGQLSLTSVRNFTIEALDCVWRTSQAVETAFLRALFALARMQISPRI